MTTARPEEQFQGMAAGQTGHERAESSSIGELVADVSEGLSTLLRQEIALARAEAKQSVNQASKAGTKFGGAALAGWMAALFLSVAIWEWLAGAMDNRGWAAIVVMVIWAIIGAVLFAMGRRDMKQVKGMERTVETTKRVPGALKGHEEAL